MLGWVALGYLDTWSVANTKLTAAEQNPVVHGAVVTVLLLVGLTAIAVWVGAVWYAVADTKFAGARKALLITVLVWGNFVGGLFYYFLYVLWQAHPKSSATISGQASSS
jgi:type VI protein secretion system component VasK